jgi:hypothetical protein
MGWEIFCVKTVIIFTFQFVLFSSKCNRHADVKIDMSAVSYITLIHQGPSSLQAHIVNPSNTDV